MYIQSLARETWLSCCRLGFNCVVDADYRTAVEWFRNGLAAAKEYEQGTLAAPLLWHGLAVAETGLRHYEDAEKHFRKALSLCGGDDKVLAARIQRDNAALQVAQLRYYVDVDTHEQVAAIQRELIDAMRILDQHEERHESALAHTVQGRLQLACGNKRRARYQFAYADENLGLGHHPYWLINLPYLMQVSNTRQRWMLYKDALVQGLAPARQRQLRLVLFFKRLVSL